MLTKVRRNSAVDDQSRCFGGQKRKFKFLKRMTVPNFSPYSRMDDDAEEVQEVSNSKMMNKKKTKKAKGWEAQDHAEVSEDKGAKDKKSKKKTWKLIRNATLTTCRYIGFGVAHLSPAAAYGSPDYYMDPKLWNKSFNRSTKNRPPPPTARPHWTSTMMFSSW